MPEMQGNKRNGCVRVTGNFAIYLSIIFYAYTIPFMNYVKLLPFLNLGLSNMLTCPNISQGTDALFKSSNTNTLKHPKLHIKLLAVLFPNRVNKIP